MNKKQLEYFLAAAETLNFTKAAEKMFVSQTAITQQIKLLEDTLGVLLFDRSKKHIQLTAAGKVFQTETLYIQKQYEQAVVRAQIAANGFTGDLRIGVVTGLYNTNAPEAFRNFHDQYPQIHLEFEEGGPKEILSGLHAGNYDYIITPRFKKVFYEGLEYVMLDQYPMVCAMHQQLPLAQKEVIQWKDLEEIDIIVSMSEQEELEGLSKTLSSVPKDIILRSVKRNENIESIMFSLSCNIGVALMPDYFTAWIEREDRMVVRPFEGGTLIDICGTWNGKNPNPALPKLVSCMQNDKYRKSNREK